MRELMTLDSRTLRTLHRTRPWIHTTALAIDWLVILGAALLCALHPRPLLYLFAVIVIGSRMHALTVLVHDVAHHRWLADRRLADLISNLTCMYPLFAEAESYRSNHMLHHRHLNSFADPDWQAKRSRSEFQFPQTRARFVARLLSYFTFYPGIRDIVWFAGRFRKQPGKPTPIARRLTRIGFYLGVSVALTALGLWWHFVLFWLVPYLTTFWMFQYIRSVAEHFGGMEYEHDLNQTRTVVPTWFERLLISPHEVHHHLEHHLHPGVPFYHLHGLADALREDPDYVQRAHYTRGYLGDFLREIERPTATPPDQDPPDSIVV
jgi:fatty acid desaturase